ncbi:ATP-binding cassette domain-containing protein [Micromonospora sp. NBC_00421]
MAKSYGDRQVFDGMSLSASPGQRIGLVGENGVGKSTLLRLLAGMEEPDAGEVQRPADSGFLRRELPFAPDATVQDVVDDSLAELRAARAGFEQLTGELERRPDDADVLAAYGDLLEWAQDHDLWDADRRAELVLAGLGLADTERSRPLATLSGGQCSRLGLAALLIRQPQAMLLDEPTNHLDDEAVGFLEQRLRGLPGVVVVASHDRMFLDEVCTDIVDLDPTRGTVTRSGGAYTEYLAAKRRERIRWEEQYAAEQEELEELREAVRTTARAVNHARTIKDNNRIGYDRHGGRVQRQISRRVRNAQQRLDFPDDEQTARQVYDAAAGADAVSLAQLGLLAPCDVDRPLGHLSVGQRRRLALALLVATPPDVLLLDEPTNHLSLSLVEELEDALRTAPGAVVVASHDRWLRRGWGGSELSLVSGKIV